MKPFILLKLPLVILALGGALIFVPQARAQSEIAPDHFDGTDSWAAAASAKAPVSKLKSNPAPATEARDNKPSAPSLHPVAAREIAPRRADATGNKRRKSAPKSSN